MNVSIQVCILYEYEVSKYVYKIYLYGYICMPKFIWYIHIYIHTYMYMHLRSTKLGFVAMFSLQKLFNECFNLKYKF